MSPSPQTSRPISPNVAAELLERVDAFFSDVSYATKGTLLSFHDGAGMIPTRESTERANKMWGNHTHAIGEGDMELPPGISWQDLRNAGLTDMRNGCLRVDLVREAAPRE